jgi:serine/threonine protein kinase
MTGGELFDRIVDKGAYAVSPQICFQFCVFLDRMTMLAEVIFFPNILAFVQEERARMLFRHLLDGLKYMHAQGVVHRDLKVLLCIHMIASPPCICAHSV